MPRFDEKLLGKTLQVDIKLLHERLLTDPLGVIDPENIHHGFVDGGRGRKINGDKIRIGSDFYVEFVSVFARAIIAVYEDRRPDALVGVADGANRLSQHIAPFVGEKVLGLTTEKDKDRKARLGKTTLQAISENDIEFALVIDDVGTTGSSTIPVIEGLEDSGVKQIEVAYGIQRSTKLRYLDDKKVEYWAVMHEILPTFSAKEAANPNDPRFQGIKFIPHGQ